MPGAAAPAIAGAQTLDKIRKTGVITLGYIDGAAPFSFTDGNGEPQGYSVEPPRGGGRRRGAAQAPGHEDPLGEAHDPEPHRGGAQEVDLECSTTTWTLSRQQLVDFSLVTFVDGGSVPVGAESAPAGCRTSAASASP